MPYDSEISANCVNINCICSIGSQA